MKGDQIKYKKGFKYQLAEDYFIQTPIIPPQHVETPWITLTTIGELIIREGYAWDGPSGPTIVTPSAMRGSLVHDALYQLMRLNLLDESNRCTVDQLLHDICEEDGMYNFRADIWRLIVGWFAAGAAKSGSEQPVLIAPKFV